MPRPGVGTARPHVAATDLTTLDAMASLASQTGAVVHVVVARQPGLVDYARAAAQTAGLAISVDAMPETVRIRFDGRGTP